MKVKLEENETANFDLQSLDGLSEIKRDTMLKVTFKFLCLIILLYIGQLVMYKTEGLNVPAVSVYPSTR